MSREHWGQLEEYLYDMILLELRPELPHGDLHVDVLESIVERLAKYMRSSREAWLG